MLALAASPAAANLSLDVDFYSCSVSSRWSTVVSDASHDSFGRLTAFDEGGEIVHQQENVPFTNHHCRAQVTISLTEDLLTMLLGNTEPPTDLFIGFEACKRNAPDCLFSTPPNQMEKYPLAEFEPINTLLDDVKSLVDTAVQDLEDRKVNRSGDTMTGDLILDGSSLTVGGTLGVTGDSTVGGTLGVTGDSTVGGTLGVTGNSTLGGTLGVTGDSTVGGTLGVTGHTTINDGATITGDDLVVEAEVLTERTVIDECPSELSAFEVEFEPNGNGNTNRLCASGVLDQDVLGHGEQSIVQLLRSFAIPMCHVINLSPFGDPVAFFSPIFAAILNHLSGLAEDAIDLILGPLETFLNGLRDVIQGALNAISSAVGSCSDETDSDSCTGGIAFAICFIDPTFKIDCRDLGFAAPTLGTVNIPPVMIPQITAGDIATALNAANAVPGPGDLISLILGGGVVLNGNQLVCDNQGNIDKIVDATIVVLNSLPQKTGASDFDALGVDELTTFHQYGNAQNECAAMSAHVCTGTEIGALIGDPPNTAETALGYIGREWVSGGQVTYDVFSGSGVVFAVDWPPIKVDGGPLYAVPPGLPLSFGLARVPTGRFQCCMSSSVLH